MKRILPLLAAATFVIGAFPAFAVNELSAETTIAQAPSGAIAQIGAPDAARAKFNFTDSQLESLKALKDKYYSDNTLKHAALKILKHDLRSELTKETIDRGAVLAIQAKINAAQADLSNARISQMLDASQIFTPEQRKAMHSRSLRHGMHGGRGRGGKSHGQCGGGHRGGGHKFQGRGQRGPGGPGPGAEAPSGTRGASLDVTTSSPLVES